MLRISILVITICTFISCSREDELNSFKGEGAPATVLLKLAAQENSVISKAVSSANEEQRLYNIYVLVIDNDGLVSYRKYFDNINKSDPHTLELKDVQGGQDKHICVLANINNSLMNTKSQDLDKIVSRDELQLLVGELNQQVIERGSRFMMSGEIETDITPGQSNTIAISLNRVDAKIRFNISGGSNIYGAVTFIPQSWRVFRVPQKVRVFPTEETDIFSNVSADYFTSGWNNFEGEGDEYGKTFAFYMLESKVKAKAPIPATGSTEEQFALREKQEKLPSASGKVENGAYTYAPDAGSYVEFKGTVTYRLNATQEVSAEVVYTVHLGYLNGDVNDYTINRNAEYIYNVTIQSVNSIIVEVEKNEEPQPGAEGNVTVANVIKEFDAHYNAFTIPFAEASIDESLTWNVSTPFSSASEGEEAKDYKWVYFRVNKKTGNTYNESIAVYPGRQNVYTGVVTLEKYLADRASNRDLLLDITQLISLLKESKKKKSERKEHLFDRRNNIQVTVFLDEYYYEANPLNNQARRDLWKLFVNQPDRVMNILSNLQTSQDQQSSKSVAAYSFRQASIQTVYNTESPEIFTAWGSQQNLDHEEYRFDGKTYSATTPLNYNSYSDGRQNSINMWGVNSNSRWNTYINTTSGAAVSMQTGYDYAKYRCMRLNRDNDGDGIIDADEVRWYLPSIDQLRSLWIGEPSMSADARLYKNTTWNEQWYVSSTVTGRANGYDNPQVLWSSEGASNSALYNINLNIAKEVQYRCVRDLGTALGEIPDEFVTYDPGTNIITLSRLDAKSIRGYMQTAELPEHHERQADNKPYWAFEVYKGVHGKNLNWVELRDAVNAGKSPCPNGWRVPNQRELVLMISMLKDDGYWKLPDHMSRTRFQFNPANSTRYGFSIKSNPETGIANTLYLINGPNERGGVRCVRDVPTL